MNLTRKEWPNGWVPSQDRNGDPSALVRMDNLQIDEKGVLGLVRGFKQLGPDFSSYVSDMYCQTVDNSEYLWVSLGDGQEIKRAWMGNPESFITLITGGGTRAAFGNSLGQVYVCSGTQRKKDRVNGLNQIRDLGIQTSTSAPIVNSSQQSKRDMGNSWTMIEGDHQEGEKIFVDKVTLRGISEADQGGVNTLIIGTGASPNPAKDRFYILIQPQDSAHFTNFRVELVLDDDNYYWKDWPVDGNTFKLGIGQQTQLGCTRDEFVRQGGDSTQDWTSVSKIRVIASGIAYDWFLASEGRFYGGSAGVLNGLYEYCTVNVGDNGIYQAKSGASPTSIPNLIFNGQAEIAAGEHDEQMTEVWFFRRSLPSGEFRQNLDGTPASDILVPLLKDFYRCGVSTGGANLIDTVSDEDVLRLNIPLNPYLVSVKDITEPFIAIEGLINERMLYVTKSSIYVSDNLNPDAIDSRFTIKAFGDPTEENYWLKKVSNNLLILGTSKDLYEISGTFDETPDGFIDVNIHGIGEEYPPLCQDVAVHSIQGIGSLFYMASDGWRVSTGSNSALISPQLVKLFQGESRYGVPAMAIYVGNNARYALAVGRNKLYCVSQHLDGTRRLFVYDLLLKYWRLQYTDPVFILATKTDRILLGYGLSDHGTYNLVEADFGPDGEVLTHGAVLGQYLSKGQGFNLQTVLDDNDQPRNRKVTFNLKLVCETGGLPVTVFIAKDSIDEPTEGAQDWIKLGDVTCDHQTTTFFKLDKFGLNGDPDISKGFRYALKITNKEIDGVKVFKLYESTIEYDPLPEQVNNLRIAPTNMGTYSRKRWTAFAIVVDTLGHDITFTPVIDNVSQTPSTINSGEKLTRIHYFATETVGTDIGGLLDGDNPFEFYGVNNEESVSEKLPTPTNFLVIPNTDYGTPARKRFTSFKFIINTRGGSVIFVPRIDGVNQSPLTFSESEKRTVEYFFDTTLDVTGTDIGGTLTSIDPTIPFEYYGVIKPEDVEVLPPRLLSFYIPTTNYGNPNRKRHTSYKFQIDTHGADVLFTPILDGVTLATSTVNTNGRRIHEHFFDINIDAKGIDIGGNLQAQSTTPFEFYKVIEPQSIETLPPRLKSLFTPSTNFGVAAKKRIRTIPFEIDTGGSLVTVVPYVDGIALDNLAYSNTGKRTEFFYFGTDVFGVDYKFHIAVTSGDSPFEFYGFGKPESVEVLPVGKLFDEVDIMRFDKIGKLFEFRIRIITQSGASELPWKLYSDQQLVEGGIPTISGTISTVAGKDQTYTVEFPKSVNLTIGRLVFGPVSLPFYRYDVQIRVSISGMQSDAQWKTLR